MKAVLSSLLLLTVLLGCDAESDFSTDQPVIIATTAPAGPIQIHESFYRNIALYEDGRVNVYSTEENDGDIDPKAPIIEVQIVPEQVQQVKKSITDHSFHTLTEDLSTNSEDGRFAYLTVNYTDHSKSVGGLNPDHQAFLEIQDEVMEVIPDGVYKKWLEETMNYMMEKEENAHKDVGE
ncbi:hypothetical protein [Gracilibacillus alcaliphilus]|uniref:hypothetical protein n=1 Tax=Gracilibacillus alcaliphilus TaxID=1401441 RepID=UPI00195E055D|nr:hypothetical protein [Gracilibacillus alcaliphilus]MBM7679079.1 hypothetical protein [Gracilibacillus alcaliphilus]